MRDRKRVGWMAVLVAASVSLSGASSARPDAASQADELISALEYDDARRILTAADGADPTVLYERARLAVYELDCDGAVAILARREVAALPQAESLADAARGCQRASAALMVDRDVGRSIEVHWQDEHDRPLGPLLLDTIAQARETLSRDLGVDWPKPTRVLVVRDLGSLAATTGLPYEAAQTTGTVAVAKWGRVTLLSPRASRHGFEWRDTLAHELTHLALTRASADRAPLWLQEGVAKREQVLWRAPGPFDDRPSNESVVQRGFELKLGVPLDRLGPSIAMLPSADMAMVAFAEVSSFVHFFVQTEGPDALPKLLAALKEGRSTDEALVQVSGSDLDAWDGKWRTYVAAQRHAPLPELFGLGGEGPPPAELRDLRERSRLAELLAERGHPAEALTELGPLAQIGPTGAPSAARSYGILAGDPSFRWLRGRLLEDAGRREEGAWLVSDPADVVSPFGPWWAMRGRWALLRTDSDLATDSLREAVSVDPLGPEAACGALGKDPPVASADPALCAAARAYPVPAFDSE
jgi:hypothetical protein